MEFKNLNELKRLRHLGKAEPWSVSGPFQPALNAGQVSRILNPQIMAAAHERAHKERALAFHTAFRLFGRGLKRLGRGLTRKPARAGARAR